MEPTGGSSGLSDWMPILIVSLVAVAAAIAWAVYRWSKLKTELFPPQADPAVEPTASSLATAAARTERAARLVSRARAMLEKENSSAAQTAAEALRKLETPSSGAALAIDGVMAKALETAEVESLLLGSGGLFSYVLAIPNRHEHAHLLRRYGPFSSGWRRHLELVRDSLIASGDFAALAAVLLFLNPEGKESTLCVSCADRTSVLIPSTLMEPQDLSSAGVSALGASVEFSFA